MSPEQARRALRNHLTNSGETVTLRRLSGSTAGDYEVRARIANIAPADVVGSIQQLKRKAVVSAEDIESSGFPLPFLPKQDRLVWGGKTLVITAIDDGTRRVQGTIVGYDLELSGA